MGKQMFLLMSVCYWDTAHTVHPWPAPHPQLTESRAAMGTPAAAVRSELTEAGCLTSKVLMKPITFLKVRCTE